MKLSTLAPQTLRAFVRKLRFARRNAGFVPSTVSKSLGGVTFDFRIGDVMGREWYAGPSVMSEEMTFLRDRMTSPGDVVLECGAHHGFMTILIAHWIGPTGRVTAFEASPASAAILRENIELNGLRERVTVEAKAVGSRVGILKISEESNSVPLIGRYEPGVKVPVVPLDDYADLEPTLIKLDIEGFEIEALRGASLILRRKPKLAIEVHVDMLRRYGHRADELLEIVRPGDYDLWLQLGAGEAPRPYAGENLNAQHMDQVHLYALPRGGSR
jgi:FkbM family methyltransferase